MHVLCNLLKCFSVIIVELNINLNFHANFVQAYVVLGQFLLLEKNQTDFENWLKDITGANRKQADDCYRCLRDWCQAFM